jgi:hypothetical protein
MSALISYDCVCGHRFVIGVAVDASLRRAGLAAASALGATYVDGGLRRFMCGRCERTHVCGAVEDRTPAVVAHISRRP